MARSAIDWCCSDTCTETAGVYAAGISVKVTRITLGDLSTGHRLLVLRGIGKGAQKSAEAIEGWEPPTEGSNMRDRE